MQEAGLCKFWAPQEWAALVLKEAFEMSLDEIAEIPRHLGRRNQGCPSSQPQSLVFGACTTAGSFRGLGRSFRIELLNASDLAGLLALMLDTAAIEVRGNLLEVGRKEFEAKGSWLWRAVQVHPDIPAEMRPPKFVNERTIYKGKPMLLGFLVHGDTKLLMAVARFEEQDGRIARIRAYNFSPEVIQEVGAELGVASGFVPYRFPTLVPGRYLTENQ